MALSMYQASVPVFQRMLANLQVVLDKAEAHAAAKKIDPMIFTSGRLTPDMFPLARQVQLCSDFAKGTGARLAGIEIPKWEDTEKSFPEPSVTMVLHGSSRWRSKLHCQTLLA